ncbi:copper chaperone PCu(A)C [Aeromicrobium duanguangcaii]|uniref:Copper chaperone PCu(A)C n=1 Tax=Aeromicrobium duanguangcaii TaxID=2968086 RepID=A0ABY5KFP1_9ACTN|nr:copper chaperone PCu(A)C [Aeromicrobium duanguangcaii]MCD9154644.1 copper chaperone PCu(A)C [Aeromicrobium duanguangcaii]UUI67942.1 copper chaperone PCu(A)C [Aeromicrobium duanguangcaii]
MFRRVLPLLLAALLTLSACGDGSGDAQGEAAGLAVADAWVKATDMKMSAAFAVLSNSGDEDVTIVGVTTGLTDRAEIHETADGAMRPVESVTIPAGDSIRLEPGGDHLMLMDLKAPIQPGEEVELTLELGDGSTFDITATAKDFAGGAEDYEGGKGH